MPRPAAERLTSPTSAELEPVTTVEPGSLLASLGTIIHWADSHEVRTSTMEAVDFPGSDIVQFLAVNQLAFRGALRPTELAGILGTGRSNMTKIVARLEAASLIVRAPDPEDDRSVLIVLSPSGRDLGRRIVEYANARLCEMLKTWAPEDRESLTIMLARLAEGAIAEGYRSRPHG